jgi:hypothetical protein
MNIPIEIVTVVLSVVGAGILAGLGFMFRKLTQIDVRMARIEEHLGIGLFHNEP